MEDVTKKKECPSCRRAGKTTCEICHGSGANSHTGFDVPFVPWILFPYFFPASTSFGTCTQCSGLGTVQCQQCNGAGLI